MGLKNSTQRGDYKAEGLSGGSVTGKDRATAKKAWDRYHGRQEVKVCNWCREGPRIAEFPASFIGHEPARFTVYCCCGCNQGISKQFRFVTEAQAVDAWNAKQVSLAKRRAERVPR